MGSKAADKSTLTQKKKKMQPWTRDYIYITKQLTVDTDTVCNRSFAKK